MAKKLHQKILELRNSVGYRPIYEFWANRKMYDEQKKEYRSPSVADENPRKIKQYFCIWGVADDYGTQPMKGCFLKSIRERGPESDATNKILVLNGHRQHEPLCKPLILKEDDIGLYGEYVPDEGIQSNDELVIRVKNGTINGGSYGFNYDWDKMEWNEKTNSIEMYECPLFEVSPVALPSQVGTFVVRSRKFDEDLKNETEALLKQIPRKLQLEMRSLITRHISLAESQPESQSQTPLKVSKPKQRGAIDYNYLTKKLS